jgi:DNA gyrase/topoisomerase IV subunit A
MAEYPTQGRHGQGVINMRLPKDAVEVVAAVIVPDKSEVLVTMALGSTKRVPLNKTQMGSRAIKPREVVKVSDRNQVTGALITVLRPESDEGETAVAQQLSLIEEQPKKQPTKSKNSTTKRKQKS